MPNTPVTCGSPKTVEPTASKTHAAYAKPAPSNKHAYNTHSTTTNHTACGAAKRHGNAKQSATTNTNADDNSKHNEKPANPEERQIWAT
ncbi:hypothetical protein GCM10009748_23390 [Agromyces lapidis]